MKIMVLSDGETWSDLEGCQIIEVDPKEMVRAMSESTTPQGKLLAEFSGTSLHMHEALVIRGGNK